MTIPRVAHRYAAAILDKVPEGAEEQIFLDIADLHASMAASRELRLFFTSPVIAPLRKRETVEALLRGRVHDYLVEAVLFLVDNRRESILESIIEALIQLRRRRHGIDQAHVATAVPLSDGERTDLVATLERATHSTIEPEYRVDPALIGGVVVRIGDTVYDGTISQQLRLLRRRLVAAA